MGLSNEVYEILFKIEDNIKQIKKMLLFKKENAYIIVIEHDDHFLFYSNVQTGMESTLRINKIKDREEHLQEIGKKITELSQFFIPSSLQNTINILSNIDIKKYIHKNSLIYLEKISANFESISSDEIQKIEELLC